VTPQQYKVAATLYFGSLFWNEATKFVKTAE